MVATTILNDLFKRLMDDFLLKFLILFPATYWCFLLRNTALCSCMGSEPSLLSQLSELIRGHQQDKLKVAWQLAWDSTL